MAQAHHGETDQLLATSKHMAPSEFADKDLAAQKPHSLHYSYCEPLCSLPGTNSLLTCRLRALQLTDQLSSAVARTLCRRSAQLAWFVACLFALLVLHIRSGPCCVTCVLSCLTQPIQQEVSGLGKRRRCGQGIQGVGFNS